MSTASARRALPLLFACAALSCGGNSEARKPASSAGNSLLTSVAISATYPTPASFRYHPRKQAAVQAERRLADGRLLLAGKRGERWLLDPRTHALSAGASLAPEDLIAVLTADDGYWFVGQSGTSYEARDPLGKFLRSSAPLEPLVRVSAARHSILGVTMNRALSRSADGAASFSKVGPDHVAFADVALGEDGAGLALAIPETLWVTSDEGLNWAVLPGKTRGVYALSRDWQGRVQVETVFGAYHFEASPPRLEPGVDPATGPDLEANAPPRGPDAAALADGRAVVIGSRYFEVSAPPARPSSYELVQGPLDGKLEASPLPELKDCRGARVAGFGRYLELACFRGPSEGGSVVLAFFRSENAGAHFEPEPFAGYGTWAGFHFVLGARGALIATGLCGLPNPGCSTGGVFLRRETPPDEGRLKGKGHGVEGTRPKYELFAAATPTLSESALGVTFSLDGRTAYAVGRRSKTGALAMFVSHDRGKSFEVRDLDLVRADSNDEDQYWEHTQALVHLESFAAAEDGSLSLVIADRHGRALIVTDEQGRLLSASKAPDEQALVAAVGTRAFALSPTTRKTWESLDGGVTWQQLARFPVALCASVMDCNVKLRCVARGCVIGNEVSRIGWAGQSEDDSEPLPPPSRDAARLTERKVRMPIACTLDEAPFRPLPGVTDAPGSRDAAFGKLSFVALSNDAPHAAASMIHGIGGAHAHLESIPLLRPLDHPSDYAYSVLDQIEGAAALRYRLPEDPAKDNHLRNVELSWDNALAGQIGHAQLADGGPLAAGDYQRGEPAQRADPDLLSIGEGGLYLRMHHAAGDEQETWYFDGHSSTRIPPIKWPSTGSARGRTEMAHTDNAHVALMFFGHGAALGRARRTGTGFEFDAQTTALPDPSAFGQTVNSNVAYVGNTSGMYVQSLDNDSDRSSAIFYPFRAAGDVTGTPIPVPTQQSLADRPSRCSPSDLAGTPRIDAATLPGTRHPVIVTDSSDAPRLFLSNSAVLHGTPQNACAAAFGADEVIMDGATSRHEQVLLLTDDLEHAWLFRQNQDPAGAPTGVQYRTMKCHFDPDLDVPSEVYRAPGTLVPRGG
ncbi:MAG: hypothetical protein ABJB12_01680 [Pseudomonadota bacterium]